MYERHHPPMGPRPEFLRPERFEQAGTDPILWAVFGLAIALLVIVALALTAMYAGRRSWRFGPPFPAGGPLDPLEFLRMRYARGKMSREEYLQASADLGSPPAESGQPPPARRRR